MTIVIGYPKGTVIVATFLLLVLASPQALADTDRIIKQAIEEAAANNPELQGTDARVAVEARRVILFGSVRLYLHKMLYGQISWQTIGVVEVDNEIRVVPQTPLSDTAIEQKIREIITLDEKFHAAEFAVTVKRGAVFLNGTFGHPQDVIFLKKRVAAIEGVIAIAIGVAFRV
ncbi:MAG: BON domain-containing protein [Gemmatimonadales bacterium]|jgi:osmotically-inducible protein OsmY